MIIRSFKPEDYKEVCDLLISRYVEPPHEISDLNGVCFVAVENDEIVGCHWALVGESTQAHTDFTVAKYEGKHIGSKLMVAVDNELRKRGVKRHTFYVEKHSKEMIDLIIKYGKSAGIEVLREMYFCRREL